MSDQRHVIKRQILQLGVPRAQDAHTLSIEMSRVYRQRILPLINRYCTELSVPDRLHRIESLEVDLGTIDAQNMEEDIIAKLSPALREALAAQIHDQDHADTSSDHTTHPRSQLELLACFVRTGSLPWWADTSQPELIDACLRDLSAHNPEVLSSLLRDVAREPRFLARIVHHVTADWLVELVGLLAPRFTAALRQDTLPLVTLVQRCATAVDRRPTQLWHSTWCHLLCVVGLGGQQYDTLQALYRAVLQRVAADAGITYDTLIAGIQRIVFMGDMEVRNELKDLLDRLARDRHDKPPVRHDADPQRSRGSTVLSSQEESLSDRFVGDPEELYVDNAGLVVLWPFLSHFFGHVGLLEEKQFKDAAARQRAVGLLQYLATGDVSFPEYLLPLNKVLCGMEVTEVFDFGEPLAEAETEECTNLLHAVIAQAPILRDMSPTGFRGSFLLRRGMLSTRDGAWLLRVERETYDVVLDRFPWTIQWVKLPWMDAPLRVEW